MKELNQYTIDQLAVKELMRHIERYEGKIVHYKGSVSSVSYLGAKDEYRLTFFAIPGILSSGHILINYSGERVVEGDNLDVWGVVKGIKTITNNYGLEDHLPEMDMFYAEIKESGIPRPLKLNEGKVKLIRQRIDMKEAVEEKRKIEKEEEIPLYGYVIGFIVLLLVGMALIYLLDKMGILDKILDFLR